MPDGPRPGDERGAPGRDLSRDSRGSEADGYGIDRHELAPASDEDLLPRIQCRPCGALRQMLGARAAPLKNCLRQHGGWYCVRTVTAGPVAAEEAADLPQEQ